MYISAACTDQLYICFTNAYHMGWDKTECKLFILNLFIILFILFLINMHHFVVLCYLCIMLYTKFGRTALMRAAEGGHNETVQILTAAGVDTTLEV